MSEVETERQRLLHRFADWLRVLATALDYRATVVRLKVTSDPAEIVRAIQDYERRNGKGWRL